MTRFTKLIVWQQGREILETLVQHSERFAGQAGLRDQMRRAAISIVSNIAEGSERDSDAEFRRFLLIAKGSYGELLAQAFIAEDIGCFDSGMGRELTLHLDGLGRQLGALIRRLGG